MAEKLMCTRCKFKWTVHDGRVPNNCPYCGQDTVVDMQVTEAKFVDVDDLLK